MVNLSRVCRCFLAGIFVASSFAIMATLDAGARSLRGPLGETFAFPLPQQSVCNDAALQTLWAHVYNPQRLLVRQRCVRATGTVVLLRPEPDGDIHIQIQVDPPYANLVAPGNSKQNGNLVVEPICMHTVTQAYAQAACTNFNFPVAVFPVGTHVGIRGSLVFDRQHGWSEIHPVEKMVQLAP